jgi:glycosyltransferase involved in cell wall biosynthesis
MAETALTSQSKVPVSLSDLPPAPAGKIGWPWTEASPALPAQMFNGQPWPRVSIVTPSYNQAAYLEETIRSVLLQGYPNLEYVIIDGGSQDGSREIIQRYSPWLRYWISEKDGGQPHAINKGLPHLTGEFFNWINSDDLLTPGALTVIATAFVETQADIVAAACVDFGVGEEQVITNAHLSLDNLLIWRPGTVYHQPAVWLRRKHLLDCGGIDAQYHFVFDWEMTTRYLLKYPQVCYLPQTVARFRLHTASKTVSQAEAFEAERLKLWARLRHTLPTRNLRKLCDNKLRQLNWLAQLREMERSQQGFRLFRALKLAGLACFDPMTRFTRMTAGAIKRHLLNQYGQLAV